MRGPLIAAYLLVTDTAGRWLLVRDPDSPSGWKLPGRLLTEDDESPEAAVTEVTAEQTGLRLTAASPGLLAVAWLPGGCLAMVFIGPVIPGLSSSEQPDEQQNDQLVAECRLVSAEAALPLLYPLIARPLADMPCQGPIHYTTPTRTPNGFSGPAHRITRTPARLTGTGTTIVSTYPCCWRSKAKLPPRDIARLTAPGDSLDRTCGSCATHYDVRIIGSATQPQELEWRARR